MKNTIYILILFLFFSCKEKYADLPSIVENMIPSQDSEMPFNITLAKNELPNKIKKIYQIQNQDTLNILEFDNQKNLIFKYYKQYQGEYWNDKFIFMLEANVYSKNKLIKTYYLHSNVGYELFLYSYSGDNIDEIKSYTLNNIKGTNINQYSFIRKIKDYASCINFVKNLDIEKDKNFNYKINRDFSNNIVKEYFNGRTLQNDNSYKIFKLNSKREIEKIEFYAKNKKWDINTKYFEYDSLGKLKKTYSINSKKDTLKSTEYKYDNTKKYKINTENKFEISKKEYFKNHLIKHKYQGRDNSYSGTDYYELDKYGIPFKIIEKSRGNDTIYSFKNYYEFYK